MNFMKFFFCFLFVWSGICTSRQTIIPPETFIDHLNYFHFFIIILHYLCIFFPVPCLHLLMFPYHYFLVPSYSSLLVLSYICVFVQYKCHCSPPICTLGIRKQYNCSWYNFLYTQFPYVPYKINHIPLLCTMGIKT